jgi:hypothetical protein
MATTLAAIQAKAARDGRFREALLRDPHAALAAEGVAVPPEVLVTVVEAGPGRVVLVLPPHLGADGGLDDDALAGSAGGTLFSPTATWGC